MVGSDSPPIGLSHPTVNPQSNAAAATPAQSGRCRCHDCEYTVDIADELPQTCPHCGGALTRVAP